MNNWFRFYHEVLDDPKVQKLDAQTFRDEFIAAMRGEESVFSPFIRGPFVRPSKAEWDELRATVFERDDFTCTYCGARNVRLECDHIEPVCRGGGSELDNLTTACFPCNRSKGAKTLEEWRG